MDRGHCHRLRAAHGKFRDAKLRELDDLLAQEAREKAIRCQEVRALRRFTHTIRAQVHRCRLENPVAGSRNSIHSYGTFDRGITATPTGTGSSSGPMTIFSSNFTTGKT